MGEPQEELVLESMELKMSTCCKDECQWTAGHDSGHKILEETFGLEIRVGTVFRI